MNKTKSTIVSAAVAGLFLGSVATVSSTLTSCAGHKDAAAQPAMEKHACAKLNSCSGKGGCKTGDKGCAGKNTCKAKGGCATVQHSCAGQNACKMQGGCKGMAGKNECSGKGGCASPVKKM